MPNLGTLVVFTFTTNVGAFFYLHVNYHVNLVNVEVNVGLFALPTLVELTFSTNAGVPLSFHVSSHVSVTNVEAKVGLLAFANVSGTLLFH